jgi:microcystin-dependent protein
MKRRNFKSSIASFALTLGLATLSPACASDPYISTVCMMALVGAQTQGFDSYLPANGRLMQLSQYQALYSLIGVTYGGNGTSNFNLPDLHGRVVVGVGVTSALPIQTFNIGQLGWANTVVLRTTDVSLPAHNHPATGLVTTASLGTLVASTTLSGLSAITTLTKVTANTIQSNLTLKAHSGNGGSSSASGAALATAFGPANNIYASSAPDASMATGSVTGSATTTLSAYQTASIDGSSTTTLSGGAIVTITGNAGAVGAPAASRSVTIMQPCLGMTYFIAINGIYPTSTLKRPVLRDFARARAT